MLERCRPVYETYEGWKQKSFSSGSPGLPKRAASYVGHLEELVGCRVRLVSLGPERETMIDLAAWRGSGTPH